MALLDAERIIGLDTSVVLRLLVGEPEDQAKVALATLQTAVKEGKEVRVSDMVVAEAYFALHAYYEVPKQEALRQLLAFLKHGQVRAEGAAVYALESALASSGRLGFVDRLIHAQYMASSAALVTFEKAAARLDRAILLKASSRRA